MKRIKGRIIEHKFERKKKDSNQISICLQETCVWINEKTIDHH